MRQNTRQFSCLVKLKSIALRWEQTNEQQMVDKDRDEMESFVVRGAEQRPRCRETSATTAPSASTLRALYTRIHTRQLLVKYCV